ncbi:MAG: ATP-binding protein [Acidobacteriia bacterium]|nr:ATP-binding protein [Terriglobia bacterium]
MRDALACAARMSREVALMGGRLAQAIGRAPAAQESALAQALAFLNGMLAATAEAPARAPDDVDPIERIAARLSLPPEEIALIVLAAMPEEHEGYASVLRALHPRGEPFATAGLAAQLSCGSLRDRASLRRLLEDGAAATLGILALSGDAPFYERTLTLADGLWPVLCGIDAYPAALRAVAVAAAPAGLDQWLESPEIVRVRRAIAADERRLILAVADSETVAMHRAVAIASASGREWAVFERAPNATAASDRLALAHAVARGALPVFVPAASELPATAAPPALERFPGSVIVCARRGAAIESGVDLPVLTFDARPLSTLARERMWRDTLPELADHAPALASCYAIEPSTAAGVALDLRARAALNGGAVDVSSVADCVRVRCSLPGGAGLKLIRPAARWDQLVLRPDRKTLLVEALNRLRHQSTVLDRWKFLDGRPGARGVRVLLSGPPGTGKTLSAEVMANSLGVDLMVVDISRVVSKWIGETEKHLAQAFDAAERTRAVLLFDEADALFGKRTEVSDAHDRYANLETAYLLSRLEQFDGLVILSTNLKQNIDTAFLRRLEFVVDFDEPTASERETLWRCHLPPQAPLAGDVNLRELAALYPVVGGLIRNASVAAGFLAAAADAPIGRDHLIGAVRREYDKSAKAFPGAPAGAHPV